MKWPLLGVRGLALCLSFILATAVVDKFGYSVFGEFTFVRAIIGAVCIGATAAIPTVIARDSSQLIYDFGFIYDGLFFTTLVFFVVLLVSSFFNITFMPYVIVVGALNCFSVLLVSYVRKSHFYLAADSSETLVKPSLFLILLASGWADEGASVEELLVIEGFSAFGQAIISAILFLRYVGLARFRNFRSGSTMSFSRFHAPMFKLGVFRFLTQNTDTFLIGALSTDYVLGRYKFLIAFYHALVMLIDSLKRPEIIKQADRHTLSLQERYEYYKRVTVSMARLALALIAGIVLLLYANYHFEFVSRINEELVPIALITILYLSFTKFNVSDVFLLTQHHEGLILRARIASLIMALPLLAVAAVQGHVMLLIAVVLTLNICLGLWLTHRCGVIARG